jgi:glucose/arabinose dehydrogenase
MLDVERQRSRWASGRVTGLVAVAVAIVVLAGIAVAVPTPGPVAAGPAPPPTFSDVSPEHPFYGHVTWMAEEGLSTGYADGAFGGDLPVSRAAVAAFLHRLADAPAVEVHLATFADVSLQHPFSTEVEWLAASGIAAGFVDGTFRPSAAISRQAMAAYLYRATDEPSFDAPDAATFPDVAVGHLFATEVEWLVAVQITTGYDDGGFHPLEPVSRQAMAAFLFRQQHLAPQLTVESDFMEELALPWDVAWTPDGVMLTTERAGIIRARLSEAETEVLVTTESEQMHDLFVRYETGLMGMVLDPDFSTNRTFYTCQGELDEDDVRPRVQVVSWLLAPDSRSLTRLDEVVDLAPWSQADLDDDGGHGGCRLRFGTDGHLWISAGDTRCATAAQDLGQLAGKVLRIDEDTGEGVPGNPFYGDDDPATDDRIYTSGHRNPQGLALRPGTDQMWSVEHGSGYDDEVNLLEAGANHGWYPVLDPTAPTCDPYHEPGAPMTDLEHLPDATPARWSSGDPTIATSGAVWLEGETWGGWDGGLAVGVLKRRHLRVLFFTDSGVFVEERVPAELDQVFGRLRAPVMGPDEDLFITTSNATTTYIDRVVRVSATP